MPLTSFEIADLNKIAELEKEKEVLAKRLARAIELLERIDLDMPPGFVKRAKEFIDG